MAQSVTKEKIVGRWKVSGMKTDSIEMSFSDPEALKAMLYENDLKKEPGKVFTADDSAGIDFAVTLMYSMFSRMEWVFDEKGTYGLSIDATMFGVSKKETTKGKYELRGGKLYVTEDKNKKLESVGIAMPDAKTIVLSDFGSAKGMNLILSKQ